MPICQHMSQNSFHLWRVQVPRRGESHRKCSMSGRGDSACWNRNHQSWPYENQRRTHSLPWDHDEWCGVYAGKKKYTEIRYGNIKVHWGGINEVVGIINEVVGIIIEVHWIIRRIYSWCSQVVFFKFLLFEFDKYFGLRSSTHLI